MEEVRALRADRIEPTFGNHVVSFDADPRATGDLDPGTVVIPTRDRPNAARICTERWLESTPASVVPLVTSARDLSTRRLDPDRVAVIKVVRCDAERDRRFNLALFGSARSPWSGNDLHDKRNLSDELARHADGFTALFDDDMLNEQPDSLERMKAGRSAGGDVLGLHPTGYADRSVLGHIRHRAGLKYQTFPSGSAVAIRPGLPGCYLPIYNEDRFRVFDSRVFTPSDVAVKPMVFVGNAVQMPLRRNVGIYDLERARSQVWGNFFHEAVIAALDDSSLLWDEEFWVEQHMKMSRLIDSLLLDNSGRVDFDQEPVREALLVTRAELSNHDPRVGVRFMSEWLKYREWVLDPSFDMFSANPRFRLQLLFGSNRHPLIERFGGELPRPSSSIFYLSSPTTSTSPPVTGQSVGRWVQTQIEELQQESASAAQLVSKLLVIDDVVSASKTRDVSEIEIQKRFEGAMLKIRWISTERSRFKANQDENLFLGLSRSLLGAVDDHRPLSWESTIGYNVTPFEITEFGDTREPGLERMASLVEDARHAGLCSWTIAAVLSLALQSTAKQLTRWASSAMDGLQDQRKIVQAPGLTSLRDAENEFRRSTALFYEGKIDIRKVVIYQTAAMMLTGWPEVPDDVHGELKRVRRKSLSLAATGTTIDAQRLLRATMNKNPQAFDGIPTSLGLQMAVAQTDSRSRVMSR